MNATGFTKKEDYWFWIKCNFAMFALIPCVLDAMLAFDTQRTFADRSTAGISAFFLFVLMSGYINQSVDLDRTTRLRREDVASKDNEIERLKQIIELTQPADDN